MPLFHSFKTEIMYFPHPHPVTPSLPLCPPTELPIHVGSRCGSSQQYTEGGLLRTLHSTILQSRVSSFPAGRVHLQKLFNMDRVQVEDHQRTHIPGGQSWTGDVDAGCGCRRADNIPAANLHHQLKGRHAVQLGEGAHQRHLLSLRGRPTTTTTTTITTSTTLPNQTWTGSFL